MLGNGVKREKNLLQFAVQHVFKSTMNLWAGYTNLTA